MVLWWIRATPVICAICGCDEQTHYFLETCHPFGWMLSMNKYISISDRDVRRNIMVEAANDMMCTDAYTITCLGCFLGYLHLCIFTQAVHPIWLPGWMIGDRHPRYCFSKAMLPCITQPVLACKAMPEKWQQVKIYTCTECKTFSSSSSHHLQRECLIQ